MPHIPNITPPPSRSTQKQFDLMGEDYIKSLSAFPMARDEEWDLLSQYVPESKSLIVDYACGSGFVTDRILQKSPESTVCGIDSSETMLEAFKRAHSEHANVSAKLVLDLNQVADESVDLTLCLGGLHHIGDQIGVLRDISSKMKRADTMMVFADFEDASASQRYFDELIHRHNPSGHIGLFISESRARNIARACGLKVDLYRRSIVRWKFNSLGELAEFICRHHGLRCSEDIVLNFLRAENMLSRNGSSWEVLHNYATVAFQLPGN